MTDANLKKVLYHK